MVVVVGQIFGQWKNELKKRKKKMKMKKKKRIGIVKIAVHWLMTNSNLSQLFDSIRPINVCHLPPAESSPFTNISLLLFNFNWPYKNLRTIITPRG
jgi:hypothetical protein